jgi:hypothetical protein
MPCLLGCLALSMPRIALVLVWLFSPGYLGTAFQTRIWPLLGFLFLPLTTLAYAFVWHQSEGAISWGGVLVLVIALLIDLGLVGSGARARGQRRVVIRGEKVG